MSLPILKLFAMCGFYLLANLFVFAIPAVAFAAWHGAIAAQFAVLLLALDLCLPLRPGPRGMWLWWCKLTSMAEGLVEYMRAECIIEGDFRKETNYLLIYAPHGLFGVGLNLWAKSLYETYGMVGMFTVADVVLSLPLLRRLMVWWGANRVSAAEIRRSLATPYPHNILMLQPDGVAGMFYGTTHEQILLKKRLGFCKVALQTGAHLVPCYAFGANQMYTRYFNQHSLAARLSSALRTSLVFWTGRWGVPFGVIPNPVKLVVAVGAPLAVTKVAAPTNEQVEALHATFVSAMRDLFERHKHRMGEEWVAQRGTLFLEDESPHRAKRE